MLSWIERCPRIRRTMNSSYEGKVRSRSQEFTRRRGAKRCSTFKLESGVEQRETNPLGQRKVAVVGAEMRGYVRRIGSGSSSL